jgi:putative ABC transport system permease protein
MQKNSGTKYALVSYQPFCAAGYNDFLFRLFGLVSFVAEQRTREIGIRKVLGASVSGVVALLSKDFLKLVTIAIVIASPLAWFFMNKWLENYTYRIAIDWWVFILAGLLALIIALVTISLQSIRAAVANPVKNLRTE